MDIIDCEWSSQFQTGRSACVETQREEDTRSGSLDWVEISGPPISTACGEGFHLFKVENLWKFSNLDFGVLLFSVFQPICQTGVLLFSVFSAKLELICYPFWTSKIAFSLDMHPRSWIFSRLRRTKFSYQGFIIFRFSPKVSNRDLIIFRFSPKVHQPGF